jgi:hypothetical protein
MMTKMTKAEKEAARIAQEEQDHRDEIEFKKQIPLHLIRMAGMAQLLNIHANIDIEDNGNPLLDIFFPDSGVETLSLCSEMWEIESTNQRLMQMHKEKIEKDNRRKLAKSMFEKMTKDERVAIQENLDLLRQL